MNPGRLHSLRFTLKNAAMDRAYRSMVPSFARRGLRDAIATSSLLSATLRRKLEHTFLAKDGNSWLLSTSIISFRLRRSRTERIANC